MSLGFLLFLCRARFLGGTLRGLLLVVVSTILCTIKGGPKGSVGSSILWCVFENEAGLKIGTRRQLSYMEQDNKMAHQYAMIIGSDLLRRWREL